jgi:hypothetical protein
MNGVVGSRSWGNQTFEHEDEHEHEDDSFMPFALAHARSRSLTKGVVNFRRMN